MSLSLSNAFDLQSTEQKKEGERFSYEVCDSKHLLLFLTIFSKAKNGHIFYLIPLVHLCNSL